MTETRIPTEAEAREDLEALFAAFTRAYVARYAIILRSTGRAPDPEQVYDAWIERAEASYRRYERYHELHWGPLR